MGEFAALEVKVETIWWRDRDTAIGDGGGDGSGEGEGQSVVFRLHFILYVEDERDDRGGGRKVMGEWRTRRVELQPLARYRRIRV